MPTVNIEVELCGRGPSLGSFSRMAVGVRCCYIRDMRDKLPHDTFGFHFTLGGSGGGHIADTGDLRPRTIIVSLGRLTAPVDLIIAFVALAFMWFGIASKQAKEGRSCWDLWNVCGR